MAFPHFYSVRAEAGQDNGVTVTSGANPSLRTAPPPEFGGPGNRWSPETLAVAAVADCLVLTFKATALIPYTRIVCDVQGKLDRIARVTSFTDFLVRIQLDVPSGTSIADARRMVDLAKHHCLITNSFKAAVHFDVTIRSGAEAVRDRDLGDDAMRAGSRPDENDDVRSEERHDGGL